MKRLIWAASILIAVHPILAFSYPQFIRHEYTACTNCHTSIHGGGLLTGYGQGIAGSMSLFVSEVEEIQSSSPLVKILTANGAVTHGAQIRLMTLKKEGKELAFFPMQVDYLAGLALSKRLRFEFNMGLHIRRNPTGSVALEEGFLDKFVLRKGVATYTLGNASQVSMGRDFLPLGLNIEDHTALVRSQNKRGVLDYATQVRLDLERERYLLTPFIFAPSWEETDNNQEIGAGISGELRFSKTYAAGWGILIGQSPVIQRRLLSLVGRVSPIPLLAGLFEYDWTHRSLNAHEPMVTFNQHAFYSKISAEPLEWLEPGWVTEFLWRQGPFHDLVWKYGPTVNIRVTRVLTFIADARVTEGIDTFEKLYSLQAFGHL